MVEITDEDSARAWLEGKPREVQVAFAARGALRAWPALNRNRRLSEFALPVLRAMLTSVVVAIRPSDEIRAAISNSNLATAASDTGSHDTEAAAYCISAAFPPNQTNAGYCAARSVEAAGSTLRQASVVWKAAALDAEQLDALSNLEDLFGSPLWTSERPRHATEEPFVSLRSIWVGEEETWDFWDRWYAGMLTGRPIAWDLQEAVALIPNGDWEVGPERVAERIREIEARFVADTLKEDIALSAAGRLTLVPTPVDRSAPLGHLLDTVEDALDLALTGRGNELTEESHQVRIIRRALGRHGNDTQRLEMEFERARTLHVTEMATDALPKSAGNRDLAQALADAAGAIRDSDADIAKNRDTLNRIRLEQISDEDGQKIAAVTVEVANASEGTLREDLLEDRFRLPGVHRDDGVPDPIVPIGAPERNAGIEAADAQIRLASRLSKIWGVLRDNKDLALAGSIASIIALIITLVSL